MKLAIRTCLGEIIFVGESLTRLMQYVRVNPTSTIITWRGRGRKRGKRQWVALFNDKNPLVFPADL